MHVKVGLSQVSGRTQLKILEKMVLGGVFESEKVE
jgi:hypothetical protein